MQESCYIRIGKEGKDFKVYHLILRSPQFEPKPIKWALKPSTDICIIILGRSSANIAPISKQLP